MRLAKLLWVVQSFLNLKSITWQVTGNTQHLYMSRFKLGDGKEKCLVMELFYVLKEILMILQPNFLIWIQSSEIYFVTHTIKSSASRNM